LHGIAGAEQAGEGDERVSFAGDSVVEVTATDLSEAPVEVLLESVEVAREEFISVAAADVDLTTWRGRRVYEVDLDGRRGDYEVIVDARSGRILSSKFDPDD